MARRGDLDRSKELFWRRTLRLWRRQRREITIREFCHQHDVSEPSFYAWRRTLAQRDLARRQLANARKPRSTPANNPPLFVPLHVGPVLTTPARQALEVVLASGRVVRVPADFDAPTLRQLLALLEEAPSC